LKKRRSTNEKDKATTKEIDSPASVKVGPYRNIEESKKH
jgi:hypothetical protein